MRNPFGRKETPTGEPESARDADGLTFFERATRRPFALSREEIVDLGIPHRGCLATNRIVVDGEPVRYAKRADPVRPEDSGWQFFAGDEDDAYMDDLENHAVYSLNTIANYDQAIIPILDADVHTAWVRHGDTLIPDPIGFEGDRA